MLCQFSYPKSCKPKLLCMIPYVSDNRLVVTEAGIKSNVQTWLEMVDIEVDNHRSLGGKDEDDRSQELRIMQYDPKKFSL